MPYRQMSVFISRRAFEKNTRTSMLAAVTSSPRVCFHLLFVWLGLGLQPFLKSIRLVHIFFHFSIFHFRALLTEEMEKEHAHINGGGCDKLATCSLFYFPLREWPRSENHFEKYSFGAHFSPFFHFSFSSPSHRRNVKRTRAHQWRRLLQACHVFAFSFSITRVASF